METSPQTVYAITLGLEPRELWELGKARLRSPADQLNPLLTQSAGCWQAQPVMKMAGIEKEAEHSVQAT